MTIFLESQHDQQLSSQGVTNGLIKKNFKGVAESEYSG